MGKGSKRRPGVGYEENYDRIFKKPQDSPKGKPKEVKDESSDRRRRTSV